MSPQQTERATASIEEVAATFGIARSTAYMLAKQNRLPVPVIRLGRRMVVSRSAMQQLLNAAPVAADSTHVTELS
jgi:excisionase family DNA binding protein